MNGLHGQVAAQHVDQARNLELFKSKHNMGDKYVLDCHRETVTPSPVQVSTFKTFICEEKEKRNQEIVIEAISELVNESVETEAIIEMFQEKAQLMNQLLFQAIKSNDNNRCGYESNDPTHSQYDSLITIRWNGIALLKLVTSRE